MATILWILAGIDTHAINNYQTAQEPHGKKHVEKGGTLQSQDDRKNLLGIPGRHCLFRGKTKCIAATCCM
jgi:hypothetical protein